MLLMMSGYATAGKDTIADRLCEAHGWERLAFADLLRECAEVLNPIVGHELISLPDFAAGEEHWALVEGPDLITYQQALEKYGYARSKELYPEFRNILQRLGTEVGRNLLGNDLWVDATLARCQPGHNYVITDGRFPNEASAVALRGGKIVRVNRPGVGPVNDHPSETALDSWDFDYVIDNDGGIEDLNEWIEDLNEWVNANLGF